MNKLEDNGEVPVKATDISATGGVIRNVGGADSARERVRGMEEERV